MHFKNLKRLHKWGQTEQIAVKSKHCGDQSLRSNWIVSGLGSANPLGYGCIIQAAEKFADLAQRFASGLTNQGDEQTPLLRFGFTDCARTKGKSEVKRAAFS